MSDLSASSSTVDKPADDGETDAARDLIVAAGEIAGAATGGALGLIGGPVGVATGAVGGVVVARGFRRLALEIRERHLAPRERVRAAAAFTHAAAEISARLIAGEERRCDGFFDGASGGRSPSEELLEGVLRRAVEEHEERKLPYLGAFYASLVFDATVGAGEANYLLRVAGGLTYGQFQCLALIASPDYQNEMILIDVARTEGRAPRAEGVLAQVADLTQTFVVGVLSEGRVVSPQAMYGGFDPQSLKLGQLRPTQLGFDLHRLLRLERIPREELAGLLEKLGVERVH